MLAMRCKYDCMMTAHCLQTQRLAMLGLEPSTKKCRAMFLCAQWVDAGNACRAGCVVAASSTFQCLFGTNCVAVLLKLYVCSFKQGRCSFSPKSVFFSISVLLSQTLCCLLCSSSFLGHSEDATPEHCSLTTLCHSEVAGCDGLVVRTRYQDTWQNESSFQALALVAHPARLFIQLRWTFLWSRCWTNSATPQCQKLSVLSD